MKKIFYLMILIIVVSCQSKEPNINRSQNKYCSTVSTVDYKPKSDNIISKQTLNFSATKTGLYMVEGWMNRYRDTDILTVLVAFKVDKLPFDTLIILNKVESFEKVYRVEVTYSDGDEIIERETIKID